MLAESYCGDARISFDKILGESRVARVLNLRHGLFYLLRKQHLSYPKIGAVFNKNHATVMHGISKIEKILNEN